MATSFKLMDNGKRGQRVEGLTQETSSALHITLNEMINVIKDLLQLGFNCVLPGTIQSDRLEKEVSIYRPSGGGNYLSSFEEILNSLNLERLKLFSKHHMEQKIDRSNVTSCDCQSDDLEQKIDRSNVTSCDCQSDDLEQKIDRSNVTSCDCQSDDLEQKIDQSNVTSCDCQSDDLEQKIDRSNVTSCDCQSDDLEQKIDRSNVTSCDCQSDDLEEENDLIDRCFEEARNLTINEKSMLYYISGYVARKENLSTCHTSPNLPESEFTDLVSRGNLVHPPGELYDLSQYLLSFFKTYQRKCCTKLF